MDRAGEAPLMKTENNTDSRNSRNRMYNQIKCSHNPANDLHTVAGYEAEIKGDREDTLSSLRWIQNRTARTKRKSKKAILDLLLLLLKRLEKGLRESRDEVCLEPTTSEEPPCT